jgi:hypothetical protein
MFSHSSGECAPTRTHTLASMPDFGQLPSAEALRDAGRQRAGADTFGGSVGIWVYTTQRTLTLAWAARTESLWEMLRAELALRDDGDEFKDCILTTTEPSVACMWADSWSLADDGLGWTRAIPSTVQVLVIVTQADIPNLCLVYDWVVRTHVACGIPVITYAPETGRTLVYVPDKTSPLRSEGLRADVLAVPRIRRCDARPRRMFMAAGVQRADVEVLAALRLDPADGFVPPGRVCDEAASEGVGTAGDEVTATHLLVHSEARTRAEGLARSTAATWDEWCTDRLHQSAWQVGMAPLQIRIIERLVRMAFAVSDNPFKRRKLLNILVEDHKGYALPPSILQDADALIKMILDEDKPMPK